MNDIEGMNRTTSGMSMGTESTEDSQWSSELVQRDSEGDDCWSNSFHVSETFREATKLPLVGPGKMVYGRNFYNQTIGYTDMQGYIFDQKTDRDRLVKDRLAWLQPFRNIKEAQLDDLKPEFFQRGKPQDGELFRFHRCSREAIPEHFHFQLRNLLGSASACEWYYMSANRLMCYNSATETNRLILDVNNDRRDSVRRVSDTIISTLCVKEDIICIGGLNGEILTHSLMTEEVQSTIVRRDPDEYESSIINSADIWTASTGQHVLVVSTNCNTVNTFLLPDLEQGNELKLEFPANCASLKPAEQNIVAVVGDSCEGLVYDFKSKTEIARLKGHMDYSFAVAWHPSGVEFVTGSQDKTVRVWDSRRLDTSLDVIPTCHAEVRSLKYSPDGEFLAIAEPNDIVSLCDKSFSRRQDLSFFAEVSGTAFSPDSSTFMLALKDPDLHALNHAGGMMEFVVKR